MEGLARVRFDDEQTARESLMVDTQARFSVAYEFVKGDLRGTSIRGLDDNENNMRPTELNSLFKLAGLSDLCSKVCDKPALLLFFGETEADKAHGKLLAAFEDFFERRNEIAQAAPNPGQSSGPSQISTDLEMLEAFSEAMFQTLDAIALQFPPPAQVQQLEAPIKKPAPAPAPDFIVAADVPALWSD